MMLSQRPELDYNSTDSDLTQKPILEGRIDVKTKESAQGSGKPRKRISRACDQCNQLRTKCDGKDPCQHCRELALTCEYARARKKRGKASRKEMIARQAVSSTQEGSHFGIQPENDSSSEDGARKMARQGEKRKRVEMSQKSSNATTGSQHPNGYSMSQAHTQLAYAGGSVTSNPLGEPFPQHGVFHEQSIGIPVPQASSIIPQDRGMPIVMGEVRNVDDYHRSVSHPNVNFTSQNIPLSGSSAFPGPPPSFRMGGSPLSAGFLGSSPVVGSPSWPTMPSPSGLHSHVPQLPANSHLRYPVLNPLLPHISAIIPITLACDLLDLYFSSTSTAFMQPQSPYILGYVFRKRSFFRDNPRDCSPALLASVLWIAAQTSESPFLTSPPSARGKICQKLLELTVGLLNPLVHTSTDQSQRYGNGLIVNGVALGGFGMAFPGQTHDMEGGNPGASGSLDDVVTYIHLATVVSASEYKAASLRWWNSAWTLARELKLGQELPPDPGHIETNGQELGKADSGHVEPQYQSGSSSVSEEEREERRRIWWLLFSVDRHLALCYNRPLFLLDVECDGLLQPEDDSTWQAGEYYIPSKRTGEQVKRRGPPLECIGQGMFGYFLPLMTILGEIVDLNHARNHPRFGQRFRTASEWEDQACEIARQLEAYGQSIRNFDTSSSPNNSTPSDSASHHHSSFQPSQYRQTSDSILQTKIQAAYATHLMHTLRVLVHGRWDPISLLEDADLWISSESFVSATANAVSAAEALNDVLEHDPDLSFMPFFFGIYLLQGSFLLLLIADKLQADANPSVVRACETIVRAHEACVVTLNTEYQRNFRKVMRSALAQVRGRGTKDLGEAVRRRETLSLYRWKPGGGGLAL